MKDINWKRRLLLALTTAVFIGGAGTVAQAAEDHAAQRVVRPDPRAVRRFQQVVRRVLEEEDRRHGEHQAVARRLRAPGALGDRRPRRRRRDARARGRHRCDRDQRQTTAGELGRASAGSFGALHLDDCLPGAQGQPEEHQGLGRSRATGRVRGHAESEDLGRRALELPRRLGLGAQAAGRQRCDGQGVHPQALQERAGARHRRARRDSRPSPSATSATCSSRGKTKPGSPRRNSGRTRCRDRDSLDQHPGRAFGGGGRQGGAAPWHTHGGRGIPEVPVHAGRPGDRRAQLLPPAQCPRWPRSTRSCSPSSRSSPSRTSAAGPRRRRNTSATAVCSTRSMPSEHVTATNS